MRRPRRGRPEVFDVTAGFDEQSKRGEQGRLAPGRGETGQAIVFSVLFLTVLIGMAVLVLDVGSWFREDRALQGTVDAAALAGAQGEGGEAVDLALAFADKNGGGISASDISFESGIVAGDTIVVRGKRTVPGVFSRVFGVASVEVHALAKARAGNVSSARWVATISVNELHPMLQCRCFGPGSPTEIALADLHRAGSGDAAAAFALLELDGGGGSAGESTVAGWMGEGYEGLMPLGTYYSVPSAMYNGSAFRGAFALRTGDDVLFPVYRPPVLEGGSNARFNIIGWVGFHLTGTTGGGARAEVQGYFTEVIWEGILNDDPSEPDFGVRAITLVE
jgi:hypothetical protein